MAAFLIPLVRLAMAPVNRAACSGSPESQEKNGWPYR